MVVVVMGLQWLRLALQTRRLEMEMEPRRLQGLRRPTEIVQLQGLRVEVETLHLQLLHRRRTQV